MSEKFQAPRGTHDVLPSEHRWWQLVRKQNARDVRPVYGPLYWQQLSTPCLGYSPEVGRRR